MRFFRNIVGFAVCVFILFGLRVWVDALVLEPHYYRLLEHGLLRMPRLLAFLPLTLLADFAAAGLLVWLQDRVGQPLLGAMAAACVTFFLAHIGQGNPTQFPPLILWVWAATSVAGSVAAAFLLDAMTPPRSLEPYGG